LITVFKNITYYVLNKLHEQAVEKNFYKSKRSEFPLRRRCTSYSTKNEKDAQVFGKVSPWDTGKKNNQKNPQLFGMGPKDP